MENIIEQKRDISLFIANEFSEENLQNVLKMEKKCFSESWQFDDAEQYFKEMLENKENINIFLKQGAEVVGYILAKPHNDMVDDLVDDDKDLMKKDNFYYIETIEIIPEARGIGGASRLLLGICDEAGKRNVKNFSIHARTVNGFSEKLKKIFDKKITLVRKIENWKHADNEPYEYIEWEI